MDLSLQALENRIFELTPDILSQYIDRLPSPSENKFKIFENPIIVNTEVIHHYDLNLNEHGVLEIYTFVTEDEQINHYLLLFKMFNGRIFWCAMRSLISAPLVWDRHFNFGPEYNDWIKFQQLGNCVLSNLNLPESPMDYSQKEKTIFCKTPDGHNLAIMAEKCEMEKAKIQIQEPTT